MNQVNIKLDQSNRAKSDFLSTLGHELRTPLNAIIGSSEMLLAKKCDEEEQDSLLKIVLTSASALLECMNGMLQFVKIERSETNIDPTNTKQELFNLRAIVHEVCNIASLAAMKKNLTIRTKWNIDDEVVTVFGCSMDIKAFLMNLITNAVKFTEQGYICVDVRVFKNETSFSIEDTGIGISDEFKSKMFQPFSQQDMSISRRYGGTGLGYVETHSLHLSTVCRFVKCWLKKWEEQSHLKARWVKVQLFKCLCHCHGHQAV